MLNQIEAKIEEMQREADAQAAEQERLSLAKQTAEIKEMESKFSQIFGEEPEFVDAINMQIVHEGQRLQWVIRKDGYVRHTGFRQIVACPKCGEDRVSHWLETLSDFAEFAQHPTFDFSHECAADARGNQKEKPEPYQPVHIAAIESPLSEFAERADAMVRQGWRLFQSSFGLNDGEVIMVATFTKGAASAYVPTE